MAANLRLKPALLPGVQDRGSAWGPSQVARDVTSGLRIAIVHEWLATYAGSERVLAEILALYPQADLFAIVDFLPAEQRAFLGGRKVNVSFIQRLPLARKRFRWYLPLMPLAIEQFDLSAYGLITSSSHAVSKGVLTKSHQLHVSYVHTPIRYAWDLQEQYLDRAAGVGIVKSALARLLMHYLRIWDLRTVAGVDYFIANSQFVAGRIGKTYRRPASVVYPPVSVDNFPLRESKDEFYVAVGRLVFYKRMDLLADAFARMPQRRLVVIGSGPEMAKLRLSAPPNVELKGHLPASEMLDYVGRAKAFIYAGEEDFGISIVEAQACGTPVLAFRRGGAAEIVIHGGTGLLFDDQTAEAIVTTVEDFERHAKFDPVKVRRNALRFSTARFHERFKEAVAGSIRDYRAAAARAENAPLRGLSKASNVWFKPGSPAGHNWSVGRHHEFTQAHQHAEFHSGADSPSGGVAIEDLSNGCDALEDKSKTELSDSLKRNRGMTPMKVAILAGGFGSRIAEETEIRPKPMVEIGGYPILWHIMRHYAHYGFNEFVVALGYKGEYIKKYFADYCSLGGDVLVDFKSRRIATNGDANLGWTVNLVETGIPTNTGGRIKRLAPHLGDSTFMLTWGDGVADIDVNKLLEFHRSHGKLATLTAVRPPARYGHLDLDGSRIVSFSEKPQASEGWINGAFFVLEPEVFGYIQDDDTQFEKEPLEKLARDGQLMAFQHDSFWQCMDTLREKHILQTLWDSGQAPWKLWN